LPGAVGTFFQQRNNGTGHENVVPIRRTTGTVLQYNDLQNGMLTVFWDTLIETVQDTVIHFLPERLDQIAPSDWNSEFISPLLKKSSSASMGVSIPSF